LISRELKRLIETGSAIRRIWSQGCELKQRHGAENVADLTLGNPTAAPPARVLDALRRLVDDPPPDLHGYTANAGRPELRERIASNLSTRGLLPGARPEHVVVTAGAGAALNVTLRAILDPGDEVILLAPYFPDYPAHVSNHGGRAVTVDTDRDFLPDLAAIERAMGERTRAIIVNHPNNPSGREYPEPLLRDLARLLRDRSRERRRPIYLLSDEPYRELRYATGSFVSPAAVYEHGLMIYSFSKSLSIPGERIGYIAIHPEIGEAGELVAALTVSNRILGFTNAPSLWQWVIADCLDAVVDLEPLRRNRDLLLASLADKGYEVAPSDGTFYLFPRTPGGDDETFVSRAMEQLLLLVPGGTFGCDGRFRMAYCVDERTIELAAERLPRAGAFREAPAAR
jgi:aspartate aminotransferase